MAYVTEQARRELLDTVAEAIDDIGVALAALGDAYELLDERSADTLEAELFRPVQMAYGRAQRTHAGFAERHGLPGRTFEPASPRTSTRDVKELLANAVEAAGEADRTLGDLQDSLRPVEVGDEELRAGLAEVRRLLGGVTTGARRFVSRFGR